MLEGRREMVQLEGKAARVDELEILLATSERNYRELVTHAIEAGRRVGRHSEPNLPVGPSDPGWSSDDDVIEGIMAQPQYKELPCQTIFA